MRETKGPLLQKPVDLFDETVSAALVLVVLAAIAWIFWPTIRDALGVMAAFLGST